MVFVTADACWKAIWDDVVKQSTPEEIRMAFFTNANRIVWNTLMYPGPNWATVCAADSSPATTLPSRASLALVNQRCW